MGAVYFYHLTRRPLEVVLPTLLEKALDAGWRVCLRGGNDTRLRQLDDALWTCSDDGFLPHGLAGGDQDDDQPILLTGDASLPPGVGCLMSVDGADIDAEEVARLDRVCVLFDGTDGRALEKARAQWRTLTQAGLSAQYWSEETGKWEMKAEA